jgi:hypothetical protein
MRIATWALFLSICGCTRTVRQEPAPVPPGSILASVWTGGGARDGIDVELAGPAGLVMHAKTNECAVALFDNLPDGQYTLSASYDGEHGPPQRTTSTHGLDSSVFLEAPRSRPVVLDTPAGKHCTAPAKLSGPDPMYTSEALLKNVEGCIVVKCFMTAAGKVRDCQPVQSLPYLTTLSIEMLKQRQYQPALCDGEPSEVPYTFTMYFRLPR